MKLLLVFLSLMSVCLAENKFAHFTGQWIVDVQEVKAQTRGVDQEGVYLLGDNTIPAKIIISNEGDIVSVNCVSTTGAKGAMKVLLASPNEIIFTYSSVGNEKKPNKLSENYYHFPEVFRVAYRTRCLEVICISNSIRYNCLAKKMENKAQ